MKHLGLMLVAVLFVVGCASSKKSESNNTSNVNNNNNNVTTGPCSAYCVTPKVCIGSTDEHSTCASPCPCESPKVCYSGGCVDLFSDPNNCG
ncbi:hypothetical protein KJ975_05180, partial [Myxococcota bacterium]|nr:hypothetical protein [Myxococcota bacterium]